MNTLASLRFTLKDIWIYLIHRWPHLKTTLHLWWLGGLGVILSLSLHLLNPYQPLQKPLSKVTLTGDVHHLSASKHFFWLYIKKANGCPQWEGKRLTLSDYRRPPLKEGARYRVVAKLRPPYFTKNPYEIGAKETGYRRHHLIASGSVKTRELIEEKPLSTLFPRLKKRFTHLILQSTSSLQSDTSGTISALLIGDSQHVQSKTWEAWRQSGIIHVMVVSGMHVTLLFGALWWLFRMGLRCLQKSPKLVHTFPRLLQGGQLKQITLLLALAGVQLYALIVGYESATARAALMLTSGVLASLFSRSLIPLSSLWFSLVVILALSAFSGDKVWLQPGFWLSYGAVLAIYLAISHNKESALSKRYPRLSALLLFLRIQLYITLLLTPLINLWTGGFTPLSPLINLIVIPLVEMLVLPVLFMGFGLSLLGLKSLGGGILTLTGRYTLEPLNHAISFIASHQNHLLHLKSLHIVPFFVVVLTIFGAFIGILYRKKPLGLAFLGLSYLLFLFPNLLNFQSPPPLSRYRLTVLDVGYGSAVLIETHKHSLLFGTALRRYTEDVVLPFLASRHISRLHHLYIPSKAKGDSGGLEALKDALQITAITSPKKCRLASSNIDGVNFQTLPLGESCALYLQDKEGASALLMGNLDARRFFAKNCRDSQVKKSCNLPRATWLLVPAGGYKKGLSKPLFAPVQPKRVLVSNTYTNHLRNPETARFYRDLGAEITLTGSSGAFVLESQKPFEIKESRNPPLDYTQKPHKKTQKNGEIPLKSSYLARTQSTEKSHTPLSETSEGKTFPINPPLALIDKGSRPPFFSFSDPSHLSTYEAFLWFVRVYTRLRAPRLPLIPAMNLPSLKANL